MKYLQRSLIIKVFQSAFDCFYGKSNVKVSFEEKEQGAGTVKPGVLKIIDEALKIEKKLELKFEYEYPRFFTTFLLESFEEELSENNMGNLKEVEIEDFGKSIYYGACNLFERYMRDFFHLHMEDITGIFFRWRVETRWFCGLYFQQCALDSDRFYKAYGMGYVLGQREDY